MVAYTGRENHKLYVEKAKWATSMAINDRMTPKQKDSKVCKQAQQTL